MSSTSKPAEKPHRAKPESSASGSIRPTKWTAREAQRHKIEQIKAKERMMKEAKDSVERVKREARIDRKRKVEEKARLEMMGRKMSAKKLDRKKRRMGLTKKVSH